MKKVLSFLFLAVLCASAQDMVVVVQNIALPTPTIALDSAPTYNNDQSTVISDSNAGAGICMTTNGTTPYSDTPGTCHGSQGFTNGNTYGPFGYNNLVLKAIATRAGYPDSLVASKTYHFTVSTPTSSPGAGSYGTAQTVTLASATSSAYICYTTDGSTPAGTASSCSTGTHYTGGFSVASTSTVKAIAYKANYADSGVLSDTYTISGGTPAYVQACVNDRIGNTATTCTFGGGTTSGNALIVYYTWSTSGTPTAAATDITVAGSTPSVITSHYDSGQSIFQAIYLATGVTAGTTSITANCTAAAPMDCASGDAAIIAIECSNCSTGSDGTASSGPTSGSATTNALQCGASGFTSTLADNDLIVFGIVDRTADNTTTWTAGTSPITFSLAGQSSHKIGALEYGTQAIKGAITPKMTQNTTDSYDAVCAAIH